MNASNGLSEEQRARIEENKRRAEAKRQQRLLGRAQPTGQNAGASPSYRPPEVPSWSTDSSASRVHSAQPSSGTYINTTAGKQVVHTAQPSSGTYTAALSAAGKQLWTGSGVKTNQKNTDSSGASTSNTTHHKTGFTQSGNTGAWQNKAKQPQGLQQTNEIGKKQFYGAGQSVLKGSCILISKDRFEVNIGYSQTLVDVFKTIGSRVYGKSCIFQFQMNWSIWLHSGLYYVFSWIICYILYDCDASLCLRSLWSVQLHVHMYVLAGHGNRGQLY